MELEPKTDPDIQEEIDYHPLNRTLKPASRARYSVTQLVSQSAIFVLSLARHGVTRMLREYFGFGESLSLSIDTQQECGGQASAGPFFWIRSSMAVSTESIVHSFLRLVLMYSGGIPICEELGDPTIFFCLRGMLVGSVSRRLSRKSRPTANSDRTNRSRQTSVVVPIYG